MHHLFQLVHHGIQLNPLFLLIGSFTSIFPVKRAAIHLNQLVIGSKRCHSTAGSISSLRRWMGEKFSLVPDESALPLWLFEAISESSFQANKRFRN